MLFRSQVIDIVIGLDALGHDHRFAGAGGRPAHTVVFSMLRGLPNDMYFKIGMITVIGLAAKNVILIVEFAVEQQQEGKSLFEAVITSSRQRLRPILMTSMAFILGVFPLFISTGAGANSRHAIGTGVIGGMIFATFLGNLLIPGLGLRRSIGRT